MLVRIQGLQIEIARTSGHGNRAWLRESGQGRRRSTPACREDRSRGCRGYRGRDSDQVESHRSEPGISSFFRTSCQIALPSGQEQPRVEKQLARVVAGFAVNVDRAGEIRCEPIVEPVWVSKPRIPVRRDQPGRPDRG